MHWVPNQNACFKDLMFSALDYTEILMFISQIFVQFFG